MCYKTEGVSELILGLVHLAAGGGGQSLSSQMHCPPLGQYMSLPTLFLSGLVRASFFDLEVFVFPTSGPQMSSQYFL